MPPSRPADFYNSRQRLATFSNPQRPSTTFADLVQPSPTFTGLRSIPHPTPPHPRYVPPRMRRSDAEREMWHEIRVKSRYVPDKPSKGHEVALPDLPSRPDLT